MNWRRCRPGGSALVAALLLCSLLLVMGLSTLAVRSREYEEARLRRDEIQARLLAEAGIDEALLKLSNDVRFPPVLADRKTYTFSETLYHPDDGHRVGRYDVTLHVENQEAPLTEDRAAQSTYDYPKWTVRIASCGHVLDARGRPTASRRLEAEVDRSPKERGRPVAGAARPEDATSTSPYYTNPNYNRLLRWEDGGAP